ncbi:MAG: amino acid ABC transporter permease [Anaerolineae bacterium]
MATTFDPDDRAIVNYDEPPIKPPPVLSVGPVAWIRTNLFKSTFDTIVTIISFIVLVSTVSAVLQWAIGAANWFVITTNLRLFMVGTFPLESLWRPEWALRLCALVVGFTLFAYLRVNRVLVIILIIVLALLFITPALVYATVPPVTAYVAVGETPIVSGTVTETPQTQVGFVARAGETVVVRVAASLNADAPLADTAGFTDRASAALVNAAINRLSAIQERAALETRLAQALLTDAQRADLTDELNGLQIPDPVTETYQINQSPVEVTILASTLEPLARASLTADSEPLTLTLPADGWYILQKISDSTGLLATTGIYPINENSFSRALPGGGSTSITQYVRMSDGYTTEAIRPKVDGQNVPELIITDNQYQGNRSVPDYMRLFIAPFFRDLSLPMLQLAGMGLLGFVAGAGLARVLPPVANERGDRRLRVRGATTWLWLLWLIALFILCYGIPSLDAVGVGILISRFVWIVWMYFTGVNHDRPWGRPLLALVTLLGVVESVIAEGLLNKIGALFRGDDVGAAVFALVGVAIWLFVGLYAARMGRSARARWGDSLRLRALIASAALWLILFVAPPLLLAATSDNVNNVLPVVDTRRWGGFLLTMLLTIVATLASFPLGVLLALGRRSSLPVVRGTCVVYIELVRGVPLITVLFMAQLLVPLVNPSLAEVDNVFRAMVGLTLFSAAYLAENVRGGLQAIPHGQEEAAKALGLSGYQVTLLILLPQALRIVIPALVGQAIALFKDTSLVALVGLIDLTGMAQSVVAQAQFIGLQKEVYLFISVLYFVFSYLMAWVSRRIEASGSGAARRV